MKIVGVELAVIAGNWDWTLIKVSTDEGVYGLGEASLSAGAQELIRALRPLLVGQDPLDVQKLYLRMMEVTSGASSYAGAMVAAISGIEIALWDLAGKALNTPSYRLWGGTLRDKVRVYCDSGIGATPEQAAWKDRAAEVKAKGFSAYKFDIDFEQRFAVLQGRPPYVPREDPWSLSVSRPELHKKVELMEAVRVELGDEIDLIVDFHWSYSIADAIRISRSLDHLNLLWIEDPIPPGNPRALSHIRNVTRTPICTGENEYTAKGFLPIIEQMSCDIVHPDIPKCGGLMEARRISELAENYSLSFAAHNVCSPVGTIASAQICSTLRPFLALEFHGVDLDWWEDLVIYDGPVIRDGYIHLSNRPGFGVELNEDVCQAHSKYDPLFFS